MQILLLSPSPPSRGVLQSLVADGVMPVVARPKGDSETDGMVRYERVTARGNSDDPTDLRWSRKALRTLVRDLRPDLIHIVGDPWTPTAEAGAAAARDLKIPYLLVGTSSRGGPKGVTAKWQASRVRDGAAALAGTVRSALEHLNEDCEPVPHGVIPAPGFEIPGSITERPAPEFPTLGVFGRVVPERGLDMLLDSLAEVYGEWRLRIVGTGPAQEAIEAHAQRLGLSARLEWLGALPREDLRPLWSEIDTIVAPSKSTASWVEPTGSVVLEAMSFGVPAVVTRCGALPGVVGESGMIIDEDDRVGLTRALQGLVEEPTRCREMGMNARRWVLAEYGDGPIAAKMVALWRRALGVE